MKNAQHYMTWLCCKRVFQPANVDTSTSIKPNSFHKQIYSGANPFMGLGGIIQEFFAIFSKIQTLRGMDLI